ncbi:MAG: phenylalanine--tRNA ligase subunit beta [Acidimicrobiia bacterium]|nr:phenylalanine--tRNA ligase subunit beta [Acidimicrobiia bacterium]
MRVSLQWLREFIDLPTEDVAELKRAFDMLGHAVESVEELEADWTTVKVGKVLTVDAHPNADKVRVTTVDVGTGDPHQIICGAWNFEAGAVVPVALPGAVLPGGFEIGQREIRGVESHGMICSERELGLGEDHEGIMVLADDTPIGGDFVDQLDLPDVVFELEVTNNRPDVMSMIGVARELAAWFEVEFRQPDATLDAVPGKPQVDVTISAPDGCNRFTAREVRGVRIGKSPLWMRERLRKAGVRAISNAVDVTNYVMMEMGHPLHAFDADAISGGSLDVRWAEDGEELETLDGSVRNLTTDDLVIADAKGPTSLAAIMGGARSEVSAGTANVLMEAAHWNPTTVMYSSRRQDLQSEASKRFERNVDPNLAPRANDRACQLLVQIAGGEVLDGQIDIVANAFEPVTMELETGEVQRLLGGRFSAETSANLLRRLALEVAVDGETIRATIPTYRPDLTRPADLIEEIARLADFDTFEATLPTGPAGGLDEGQRLTRTIVGTLRGLGLNQAVNLPFVSPAELEAFSESVAEVVSVRNPLRDDQSKLRQSLLPALLRNVRENLNRGAREAPLFEIGRVFIAKPWADDPRVPEQPNRLAIVLAGDHSGQAVDAASAFGIVAAVAERLGIDIDREAAQPPGFHPTRTAALEIDGNAIGYAGEIHPDVLSTFEIDTRVAAIEVTLDPLIAGHAARQMRTVSTYPHVDFDLSFDVPSSLAGGDLVAATSKAATSLEQVDVFDDFTHPDTGQRSVALRYRLRAPDRTLERAEIDSERDRIVAAAAALGATLRGA